MSPIQLDSQQVEILGRNLIKASLIEAGIEVATPERDNGIDLIAYRWCHGQMVQVGDAMAWTKSASWTERDGYSTRHPSPKLLGLLAPHRVEPAKWAALMGDHG